MIRRSALGAVIAVLAAVTPTAAAPTGLGHIELVAAPVTYGGVATFSWTLTKRPQVPTLGVFCQQGNGWAYIAELSVPRTLTGEGSVIIENEMSSALPGTLDYAMPASCVAGVFDEYRGGRNGAYITDLVSFTVSP